MDTTTDADFLRIFFLLRTHDFAKEVDVDIPVSDFQLTTFSDNVVVSAPPTADGLAAVVLFCFAFSWRLLVQWGYLCRGAIVKGPLHHRDSMIFGSGLIDAYNIESQVADVPRIIVRRDVVEDIEELSENQEFLRNFRPQIRRSDDGPFIINFLAPISKDRNLWTVKAPESHIDAYISPEEDEQHLYDQQRAVKGLIERRLDAATDHPRIYRKVRWIASQYNREVAGGDPALMIRMGSNG
jgi:hypothetical protein